LSTANSATYNQSGRPVRELRLAMTRLGERLVQSLAFSFMMRQMRTLQILQPVGAQLHVLWKRNITAAVFCRELAGRAGVHPDAAFLTGLLSGTGRLYILVRTLTGNTSLLKCSQFNELIDSWHAQIGAEVLANWGFIEEARAVGAQEEFEREASSKADLSDVLIASNALTTALDVSQGSFELPSLESFSRLGLTADTTVELLRSANDQIAKTLIDLNF
jgi:HD-like signal output (HDOD) protein